MYVKLTTYMIWSNFFRNAYTLYQQNNIVTSKIPDPTNSNKLITSMRQQIDFITIHLLHPLCSRASVHNSTQTWTLNLFAHFFTSHFLNWRFLLLLTTVVFVKGSYCVLCLTQNLFCPCCHKTVKVGRRRCYCLHWHYGNISNLWLTLTNVAASFIKNKYM